MAVVMQIILALRAVQMAGESASWWGEGEALNWDAIGAAVECPAAIGQLTAFIHGSLSPSVYRSEVYYLFITLRAAV